MSEIKAIETSYKGYRFRSRLEARWAVYFDALGCCWEYEPQGFDLGEMGRYLPDFRVGWRGDPEARMYWAEVKPLDVEISAADGNKIRGFVRDVAPIILLTGTPGPFTYPYLEGCPASEPLVAAAVDIVLAQHKGRGRFFLNTGLTPAHRPLTPAELIEWPDILPAVTAARSVRFEHGDTPR